MTQLEKKKQIANLNGTIAFSINVLAFTRNPTMGLKYMAILRSAEQRLWAIKKSGK